MEKYPGAEPFDLWSIVPPSLAPVLPNVMWSRQRLHRLTLPIVQLQVDELSWQLELPWWKFRGQHFAVAPNDVRRDPVTYADQWNRMQRAELRFPIHLLQRDRKVILDGVHRLLKATVEGRQRIAAHVLSHEQFIEDVIERRYPANARI